MTSSPVTQPLKNSTVYSFLTLQSPQKSQEPPGHSLRTAGPEKEHKWGNYIWTTLMTGETEEEDKSVRRGHVGCCDSKESDKPIFSILFFPKGVIALIYKEIFQTTKTGSKQMNRKKTLIDNLLKKRNKKVLKIQRN